MGVIVADRCRGVPTPQPIGGTVTSGARCVPSHPLRILLVVNSFASSVTARNTVVVHRRLAATHDVELVETNRRGHATRFAHDAARRGVDVVIGFGGDGTLNEVATGIAGTDTALGVLPGGSTNVFARTIGLPERPGRRGRAARRRHRRRRPPPDRARPGQRPVLLLPHRHRVRRRRRRRVERRASLKRWLGHPLFIYAGVTTWLLGLRPPAPALPLRSATAAVVDRRLLLDRAQHQPVHVPRQPAARPVRARRRSTRPRRHHVQHDEAPPRSSARSPARCAAAG